MVVGEGVVVGQGGPEHSAISSGSPGHWDVGWLCFVNTRYLVRFKWSKHWSKDGRRIYDQMYGEMFVKVKDVKTSF